MRAKLCHLLRRMLNSSSSPPLKKARLANLSLNDTMLCFEGCCATADELSLLEPVMPCGKIFWAEGPSC